MTMTTLLEDSQKPLKTAKLSENLTLGEFLATSHHEFDDEQSDPPQEVLINARRHAIDLWQPCRDLIGPMAVSSGYRCPGLNAAVGGAVTSAHMDGRATDNIPIKTSLLDAYMQILQSSLPFDQLIWEFGRWIHLGSPKHWDQPRREALMKFAGSGYELFNPNDPRITLR